MRPSPVFERFRNATSPFIAALLVEAAAGGAETDRWTSKGPIVPAGVYDLASNSTATYAAAGPASFAPTTAD